MRDFCSIFLRVDNRKKRHTADDFIKAGYPMVELDGQVALKWSELHQLCGETFTTPKGQRKYIWFGSKFFFLTQEDAYLFKTLWLLL